MSTHQLAQWKPGDLFAIKPTQFRRFYRNVPFAGNQEGSVTSTTVNLDLIYIVTAVYVSTAEAQSENSVEKQNKTLEFSLKNNILHP